MCGIVGIVSQRNILKFLLTGLNHLEYRGYDSSGLAVIDNNNKLRCIKKVGKVNVLEKAILNKKMSFLGKTGVAHTRWATHGPPTENNAHPHISGNIAVVHNGIIENHEHLRSKLKSYKYKFNSDTDTEVIAHLIHWEQNKNGGSLTEVVKRVSRMLFGIYSTVVMDSNNPNILIAECFGSPLIIGLGICENSIASDQLALLNLSKNFIFLKNGDIAEITNSKIRIWDKFNNKINRDTVQTKISLDINKKGNFKHFLKKEIFEQPKAIKNTLKNRIKKNYIYLSELSGKFNKTIKYIKHIKLVACGSSYNSAMVSKYWFEKFAGLSCNIEIASEFCYRKIVICKNSLLIFLSQSGETADILSALRLIKKFNYVFSISICNTPESSLIRESEISILTHAGVEISVASTKTFTTQLTALLMLISHICYIRKINEKSQTDIFNAIQILPNRIEQMLLVKNSVKKLVKNFSNKKNVIIIGRGELYPIAIEAALKLKETSYIHAEGYAAGELKHGTLALIDTNTPVIVLVCKNKLLRKTLSNIEEIKSRGGQIYIFSEKSIFFSKSSNVNITKLPFVEELLVPMAYIVPMQLLSYYIGIEKNVDVDHPRNLAKTVTVE
ncbi:glmS [Wigglesworthia glossinidia endosymbiont of Glossina brevipalpis]|uniref:Glutamine--fructose-6-phosphate aminotransferase [isomerizing] n=1 Tax=Wigglesworthia glossinidia brevipalpis TaxID=36870 RepID=GLMS_WIGBR|nr:RecName: Full=Glutamine--fructose-6-phosphate aminotransferase [isomerizing]; AltName: Full=D-fructose-6-phosphate amidotransferase; AltName: Full=GFAT; AltName: Full=Glucosamine-6-phosphate synthase; AltName: Full=Hexosephosphate aminotransferase; AltName: Full=L-glutamine--D-fructose-6-phosphate amidotransferase [Wigglesworthia glossinidia endosymbiont of Glossina brevipalpis]BAC24157.1 glmS [Wigglesworthia glossinidia endosymbiont of Glossina brevipalpis]